MKKTSLDIDSLLTTQCKTWMRFGVATPILFLLLSLYLIYNGTPLYVLYWTVGIISAAVCFVWWMWALLVIIRLVEMNSLAGNALTEMREDVKLIAHEVRESKRDLFILLDALDTANHEVKELPPK